MAGSMVGYLLGSSLYKEAKDILKNPNWSQEQREELKLKYTEAVDLIKGYKEELSAFGKKYSSYSKIIAEFLNHVETQAI